MITVQVKAQINKDEMKWFDIEVRNDNASQIAFAIEEAERQARKDGLGFVLCNFRIVYS